ncbi:50S ribosomal protein L32 [Spirochaetota bacterium]
MALPKFRKSKSKSRSRRAANEKRDFGNVSTCPQCGAYKLPHRICTSCGFYKGIKRLTLKEKKS